MDRIKEILYRQGYKVYPEVEDYVSENLNDFIGISLNKVSFLHIFVARKLGLSPEDILLSLIIFEKWGWFTEAGMFGRDQLYIPVMSLWK